MANELDLNTTWTFYAECSVPREVSDMLVAGEQAHAAFKTIRDVAVFTNKRLIVRDSQGLTGKKIEQYSLPWSSVNMWSSENAGHLDLDSEIELWTRAGHVKISLRRGADIRRIDALIADHVLGGGGVVPVAPAPAPQAQQAPQYTPAPSPAESAAGMFGVRNPFKR